MKNYYNIEIKQKENGIYVVGAMQHFTYDFCMGEGKTVEEAKQNLKPAINAYDDGFKAYKKKNFDRLGR